MTVPHKSQWVVTASSGEPALAADGLYSTAWVSEPGTLPWYQIDLGEVATLGGLEVYWGRQSTDVYAFESSVDGKAWQHLCATRHGEGGQNVFAFPASAARFVRWRVDGPAPERGQEIVEVNLYSPSEAMKVREPGRLSALGRAPVRVPAGESITVDFGYVRSPLGVLVKWGESYGTVFSVHLSDDGESFREVGRILTGDGDYDSFYWRTTTSRYLRFTVDEASDPAGAIVNELKVRILNKDRMPFGQLERAALAARADLVPQTLLGRQVYWTVLGEIGGAAEALFDEYANLEAQRGFPQMSPLLRLDGSLHGVPGSTVVTQTLAEGSLPIPTVQWAAKDLDVGATALAHAGQALVEYRLTNSGSTPVRGALVLAVRPAQVNPYWQHGGHAVVSSIAVDGNALSVNGRPYAVFSREPDAVAIADFEGGDVVTMIERQRQRTERSMSSGSGLLSAACEFDFSLQPGDRFVLLAAAPLRDDVMPSADVRFSDVRESVRRAWREKLGPRRIRLGDREVSDTVEAQTALILVNATRHAFKPGPRNYDRTWIRDGSSQALALLYAGLVDEAMAYVLWYSERIYENGMVPPILNPDGSINRGYGSDIEFDAQGQFVAIAADTYRLSRDRDFLNAIFEPVVRVTRFIEELCARTAAIHGPDSRFQGLLAPSISHEGYNKPSYSYWDNFFALRAWRDCEYLANEIGDPDTAQRARMKGQELAASISRSMRMTTEAMGTGLIYGSADREDVDPTSTSIAFDPCRVADVLPVEWISPTYDRYREHLDTIRAPDFVGGFSPYEIRNLNAFVSLGRFEDAFQLLADALTWRRPAGWRHWAEVVWSDARAADYIGDMPHTWIGAEFATAVRRMLVREDGTTLELFRAVPASWWEGDGIILHELPTTFGRLTLKAVRDGSQEIIEMSLSGLLPERITVQCPGAKRAEADGIVCEIDGDVIKAPAAQRIVIEF